MAEGKHAGRKSTNRRSKIADDPPWDDAEIDAQQAIRSGGPAGATGRPGDTAGTGKPKKKSAWARYRATIDAQSLIIRNILKALALEQLTTKTTVKELIAGAARVAEDNGKKATARHVRRIGANLFPK